MKRAPHGCLDGTVIGCTSPYASRALLPSTPGVAQYPGIPRATSFASRAFLWIKYLHLLNPWHLNIWVSVLLGSWISGKASSSQIQPSGGELAGRKPKRI